MVQLYLTHTSGHQIIKLTLKEIQDYIGNAKCSELLADGRLYISTADGQHLYINIPTVKAETIFPVEKGFATGRKIENEKSRNGANFYLCKDGKIRELPPPRSCA